MIDLFSLLKTTSAYKTVQNDKENNMLSHAYLILCEDSKNLKEYLKIFAKLIVCKEGEPCFNCRFCKLIQQESFSDVIFYPKGEENIVAKDITSLIEESFIKPLESDKKIFVLLNAEKMNASSQNKLLKTLEEPPKNVQILIGATNEFSLLSTIKSRVKKLEIPSFSDEQLIDALKENCPDRDKLEKAIICGDKTVGKTEALYWDENLISAIDTAIKVLTEMQSSKDVLKYSSLIAKLKCDFSEFLSVLSLLLRDMLLTANGKENLAFNKSALQTLKNINGFSLGAIVYALDSVEEAFEKLKFNANVSMLTEWLCFKILEGKYKWQKS